MRAKKVSKFGYGWAFKQTGVSNDWTIPGSNGFVDIRKVGGG
jgi:hypothetical protein